MMNLPLFRVTCALGVLASVSAVFAAPPVITPGSWTLAILPDMHASPTMSTQTQFLVNNKTSLNLAYVLQEGDLTNSNSASEWTAGSTAFQYLDNAGIGYSISPGNHDYSSLALRTSSMATYFPVSRLGNQPTFGGVYPAEPSSPLNSYSLFSAGGTDWLVLSLEFGPRDAVVQWADNVMKANPTRQAMIVTHAYLYSDSTRYDWATKGTAQNWNPHSYISGDANDGEEMWQQLKDNANLKFVFNGHVLNDGTGFLASAADDGHVVNQMLANFQLRPNGYMRLLEFLPDGDTVHVRTYSPSSDSYLTAADQDFTFSRSTMPPPPTIRDHAMGANLVVGGPALPSGNPSAVLTVPQSGTPAIGTLQANRGDYEISVGGSGITYDQGILLASVTQNVRDEVRGTVEAGRGSFGLGLLSLSVMQAGVAAGTEANFNTSVAWFEFNAGWKGAHVNADGTLATAGNGITSSMLTKSSPGRYALKLGVDSRSAGMLFTIGNNNSNKIVDTGVLADGSGWDIRVQDNAASFAAAGTGANWSFLYLPFSTKNLIGGRYNGDTNAHLASAGAFTMTQLGTGQYKLTIPGESPTTGMLILTVSKEATIGGVTAPDDNILNYESDGLGNFLIYSYDLTGSTNIIYENTEFDWAFIDFAHPITCQSARKCSQ